MTMADVSSIEIPTKYRQTGSLVSFSGSQQRGSHLVSGAIGLRVGIRVIRNSKVCLLSCVLPNRTSWMQCNATQLRYG